MKKLNNNKKGFTLIELLAVIVILAILVMIAIPAVTRYLDTARKGTFADAAQSAISAVRMDYVSKSYVGNYTYTKKDIDELLEKKLITSPFGKSYSSDSAVTVTQGTDGATTYSICLADGYRILNQKEKDAISDKVEVYSDTNKCPKATSSFEASSEGTK